MKLYVDLVKKVLQEGIYQSNRTNVRCCTIAGALLEHDLRLGFPLLTTKKMAFHSIKVELEFFIKGITNKAWLKERQCSIWNEWHNPTTDDENDLGPIYGYQWRNFGGYDANEKKSNANKKGYDQLKHVVEQLKINPLNRRLIVSAWNPLDLPYMALPPCHVLFHLITIDNTLHLTWFQRSCDLMIGIPFNLASYALLLHLLAKESNLQAGKVIGMLSNVHIYENHIEQAKKQLKNNLLALPQINTENFTDIFNWEHNQTVLINYSSHEKIHFSIAV